MIKFMWYFFLPFYLVFLFCPKFIEASETDLLISEIMYDAEGSDSDREWVEVYNSSQQSLLVSSTWRFFDGANHNLNLFQGSSTIAAGEFFILAADAQQFLVEYPFCAASIFDTVMSLGNSSSSIALSFDVGATHSSMTHYENSWGAAGNGRSLEKIILSQDDTADNWQESFVLGGSPGTLNSTSTPIEDESPAEEDNQAWQQIIISEFLPNPEGSDDNEWIELYNGGTEAVDLDGFSLQDNSSRRYTINQDSELNLLLAADNFVVLPKSVTGISLNNSNGDAVKLYDPLGNLQQIVEYTTAIEGRSYANDNGYFDWTKTPTPGSVNQFVYNQAPRAQIVIEKGDLLVAEKISFSAKNSSDPEGDDLDYNWDFGDGQTSSKESIKHAYKNIGSYTVLLEVVDSEGASDQAQLEVVIEGVAEVIETEQSPKEKFEFKPIDFSEDDFIISEFIPNPEGSDDNEWIELHNNSEKIIDLLAWQLDDAEGGSKPYMFATSTKLGSGEFLLVSRQQSKITLNNSNDSVRLLTPEGSVWQEVSYEKVPEAQSQSWDMENNEWFVGIPSPGQKNIVSQEPENIFSVAEAKDMGKGEQILVQGVAINDVGSQDKSFYLLGYDFSDLDYQALLEIYSYYKNFPNIKAGQLVTIRGALSKIDAVPRLKVKTAEDVWLNDVKIELAKPEKVFVDDIDEDMVGDWVTVQGLVSKKSGKNIYLSSAEDEEYLLRVYSSFSNKELEIKKGTEIVATGILLSTDSGFKLLPQSPQDIVLVTAVLGEKIKADSVAEKEISSSSYSVVAEDRQVQTKIILWCIIIGVLILAFVYMLKKKLDR